MYRENKEKVIAITNRQLISEEDFLGQLQRIVACKPRAVVLREKDLSQEAYRALAMKLKEIAAGGKVPFYVHKYWRVARELGITCIHMPLQDLKQLSKEERTYFREIGTSVHSIEELREAERLGATYVFAGHIFMTDCKKGLEPRGIEFLKRMIDASSLPVYAIGGIDENNANQCIQVGAAGVCVMSGCMKW